MVWGQSKKEMLLSLFVVSNRLRLMHMSYLDGVELRAGLQSMMCESNTSFDYAYAIPNQNKIK